MRFGVQKWSREADFLHFVESQKIRSASLHYIFALRIPNFMTLGVNSLSAQLRLGIQIQAIFNMNIEILILSCGQHRAM